MYPEGFQWDEKKNELNREKHGIDFNDASKVFERPTLEEFDDRKDYGEVRYNSIGQMDDGTCINVTHTERDGDIRIISARCADKNEREQYQELVREYNSERQVELEAAPSVEPPTPSAEQAREAQRENQQTSPDIEPEPAGREAEPNEITRSFDEFNETKRQNESAENYRNLIEGGDSSGTSSKAQTPDEIQAAKLERARSRLERLSEEQDSDNDSREMGEKARERSRDWE